MLRLPASVSVEKEAELVHRVVVGALTAFDYRDGRDGQRHLGEDRWLEDSLRSDQRNALAIESEALREKIAAKHLSPQAGLSSEKIKRRCPNPLVELASESPGIRDFRHRRRCRFSGETPNRPGGQETTLDVWRSAGRPFVSSV
jgi:hypothetical protein